MEGKYERNLVLKERRRVEGISREKLSAELGLDRVAVCRYELGARRVPLKVRNALVVRYGGEERDYRQRPLEIREVHGNVKNPDRMNNGLRKVIYEAGLTPVEVCKIAGKSTGYLYHYINGKLSVGRAVAGWIAPIVGCSVGNLISSRKGYLAWSSGVDIDGGRLGVGYNCAKFSFDAWKDASRQRDIQDVVGRSMERLPERDREILTRCYFDGRSLVSMANGEGRCVAKLFERKKRALIHLGDILERMGFKF